MKSILFIVFIIFVSNLVSQEYNPGDHELLFMPTAYTMPKGTFYFSDYELLFLNFTAAPFARTHLGVFTFFPITSDFLETVSFGIKHNYFRGKYFASAVFGSLTPKTPVYTVGNVISIGTPKTGLHAAISAFGNLEEDSEAEILYLLGTRYHILILEYTNLKSWAEKDFNGIISFGFRISGKKISWDIGGFRPINEEVTNSPLILLPFLKATVHFGG